MPGEEEESLGSAAQLLTSAGTGTLQVSSASKETPRTNHEGGGGSSGPLPAAAAGSAAAASFGLPKIPHPPIPVPPPPPLLISSSHHAEIEEAETPSSTDSGGSKLELELQFAGVDNETVELEEVECNYGSAAFGSTPVDRGPGDGEEGGEGGEDQEVKPPDPPPILPQTLQEKCLFYTTAFFILMAIFSLFLFLFLVPFVIDPAFTTIFNEFDPEPALCRTEGTKNLTGTLCRESWTSCREGCTKDIYNCTQIFVSYKAATSSGGSLGGSSDYLQPPPPTHISLKPKHQHSSPNNPTTYYNYNHGGVEPSYGHKNRKHKGSGNGGGRGGDSTRSDGWYPNAHLFPNVKGCGYPPSLNCTIFLKKYAQEGTNFSCYYSKVKPWIVVTSFNMNTVVLELALSMAIPIPCFIVSVIYLIFAYFKIYNTSSTASSAAAAGVPPGTTNNNGPSPSPEPPQTSLSTLDEKARSFVRKSSSRTLNALTEKLLPNSKPHPPMEMNDLTPIIGRNPGEDSPIRNNRAPERNGPTNQPVKNKGNWRRRKMMMSA